MSEITYNENNPNGPINRAYVTTDGQLSTIITGVASTVNMSTTNLSSGSTYTGTGEMNDAQDVMFTLKTDQNTTIYMDFGPDGVNWDSTLTYYYNTTRINPPHILTKGPRYFRIRATNTSGVASTYFRLNVYFGTFSKLTSPIDGIISENYDAIATRPSNYHYEVARGKRQGDTTWNKWGYNPDIDASVYETVWSVGGVHIPLTGSSLMDISSTSAGDTAGGTGARSIIIYGVDENYDEVLEVVTMNGTASVSTTNEYLGINRMSNYLVGVSGSNIGDITANNSTPQAQIPAEAGSTQHAFFFVPVNHTA